MSTEIRATHSPGETRVAVVQDGELIDYAIYRPGAPDGVGDRLRGRVVTHVPGMAGAFVALPDRADGFLPDSAGGRGRTPGDAVTVTVIRAAQGGKGPRLSLHTEQAGAGPPALLAHGPDALARMLAQHPGATLLIDDPALHRPGATVVPHAWTEDVQDAVEALGEREVELPGGLRASVFPTPALVAIDVDMAAATAERGAKPAVQREANRAALPGLARAVRLRNLSGVVLIDLAGMAVRARAALLPDAEAAFAADPLRPNILGFTGSGLLELVRTRVHPPLHELLGSAHGAGLRALRALDAAMAADPATPLALRTAPDVARALEADAAARADLVRRTGRPLILRRDPALPPRTAILEPATSA